MVTHEITIVVTHEVTNKVDVTNKDKVSNKVKITNELTLTNKITNKITDNVS